MNEDPRFAVFGCQTQGDRLAAGWVPESDAEEEEAFEDDFAARITPIHIDLPSCPTRGGPSFLLDVLRPR